MIVVSAQTTFSAYFDASGTKRSPILTVAGFVGRASKWERFNREWNEILVREGVGFMHMTEFVSSRSEFSSWKGQTDRRRECVGAPRSLVVGEHEVPLGIHLASRERWWTE